MPIIRILLVALFLFIAYSAFVRYEIAAEMAERRAAAEVEIAELKEQRERLEGEVEYLSNERGIEGELRRQFDIALPGEEVVVILDEPEATETLETIPVEEDEPWYRFW
jgi:cell division protein FtsB